MREERSNKSAVLAPSPAGAGTRGHIESRLSTFKERASQPASSKQSGMRSPSLHACLR
eukprot:COSAG01_NODE_12_length_41732_cov_160.472964_28_plen_58_part_00